MDVAMELRMEMRSDYTDFGDTANKDVMGMARQTKYWKSVSGQIRIRE